MKNIVLIAASVLVGGYLLFLALMFWMAQNGGGINGSEKNVCDNYYLVSDSSEDQILYFDKSEDSNFSVVQGHLIGYAVTKSRLYICEKTGTRQFLYHQIRRGQAEVEKSVLSVDKLKDTMLDWSYFGANSEDFEALPF